MRVTRIAAVLTALTAVTCTPVDRSALVAPSGPQFAHLPDLEGTPDLIVDAKRLADSWVVYEQELKESFCSISEGGTSPGFHRVLRFTVTTPNIGDADIAIGDPAKHIDPNGDGDFSDSDGLYELSTCHRHWHFRNYAKYELIQARTGRVIRARKHGFCMIDVTPWNSGDGGVGSWVYRACGRPARGDLPAVVGNQGISVGYADTYFKWLGGQYFVLDEDPAGPVPPGDYTLRITVNPPFVCGVGDEQRPRDSNGMCHMFVESNYDNNVGEAQITIPDHPGKTGFGPGGGQDPVDEIIDDEDRPDK